MRSANRKAELKLRWWRNKRGFTLVQLAELTGISKQQLSAYENNVTYPTLRTLYRLADGLSVPVPDLFFISNGKKQDDLLSRGAA